MSERHILVAVAWPYASGSRHLGHIAGAYLPADIFARYHRIAGNRVLMVSGSDTHGTPITVRADAEGVTPAEIVDRYHTEFQDQWEALGISWDLYTSTGTENHEAVTHDVFLRLLERGHLDRRTTDRLFDPVAESFLPDRYVEGKCPHCGYPEARGDQCDNCGRTLDPEDLINPRSKLSGETPITRPTEHFFLRLSDFGDELLSWLKARKGWRKHVQNWAVGFVEEGLIDRAITRDLEWGVSIPVEGFGDGKRIYVWFEAVIGYLSASKEWAQRSGDAEAWRAWWENPEAESYYFIGKDNIPFHAVIWPAILLGYGGLNLPTNVPANQFVTFRGEKASASRGVGQNVAWYTERFQPDAIRYALAAAFPETADTEITDEEIVRRINDELVATWGNLANRVITLTHKTIDGVIPELGNRTPEDDALIASIDAVLATVGEHIEAVELRAGLRAALDGAQQTNIYLNATAPWKTSETDPESTAVVLRTALDAIAGLSVAFEPYLPFSSAQLREQLGVEIEGWRRPQLAAGTRLGDPSPLYRKIDPAED